MCDRSHCSALMHQSTNYYDEIQSHTCSRSLGSCFANRSRELSSCSFSQHQHFCIDHNTPCMLNITHIFTGHRIFFNFFRIHHNTLRKLDITHMFSAHRHIIFDIPRKRKTDVKWTCDLYTLLATGEERFARHGCHPFEMFCFRLAFRVY